MATSANCRTAGMARCSTCVRVPSTPPWVRSTTATVVPAEWIAVVRKLMTLDFVLTKPAVQFWATEEDKTALLRELNVDQQAWPAKRYQPRHDGKAITTRHFVDKMPWYREPDDPRVWFAYVNAESTLAGFDTFLREYAAVLESLPSGVSYIGRESVPRPCGIVVCAAAPSRACVGLFRACIRGLLCDAAACRGRHASWPECA